jgi:hypothetical protein
MLALAVYCFTAPGLLFAGQATPPGSDAWKYDVVHRHKGAPLKGLVIEQGARHVVFKSIVRKPGRPTLVFTEYLPRTEVARIVDAEPAERALLAQRLEALAREHEALETRLKAIGPHPSPGAGSADAVTLRSVPWIGATGQPALEYESSCFRLHSNANPAVVELAAIRLEQVYAAYARALPPRVMAAAPTTIVLARSLADYRALAREQGLRLANPAFYDAGRNRVLCASDLQRLGDELENCRRHHDGLRAELKKAESQLAEAYGGPAKVPAEVLAPIHQARREMQAVDDRNEATFRRASQQLFQRLFHEAFHAYVANYVYPASEGELPRWLNEGLAQIFETAIVELDELRVGHADKERRDAVRLALARGTFPSVAELLRTGPRQFLVAHASERPESDRTYLASWALSFYLTFGRRLLGTPGLEAYVRETHRGGDPLAAFESLVGQPLAAFETEYLEYLKNLKADGSGP